MDTVEIPMVGSIMELEAAIRRNDVESIQREIAWAPLSIR